MNDPIYPPTQKENGPAFGQNRSSLYSGPKDTELDAGATGVVKPTSSTQGTQAVLESTQALRALIDTAIIAQQREDPMAKFNAALGNLSTNVPPNSEESKLSKSDIEAIAIHQSPQK